jgi:hypothetical protein
MISQATLGLNMNLPENIRNRVRHSAAFLLYCGLFLVLFVSVLTQSGSRNLPYLLVYSAALLLSYGLFLRLFRPVGGAASGGSYSKRFLPMADSIANGLLIASVLFILLHFAYLGQIPVFAGIRNNDYYDIMRIRQSVFYEASAPFRYVPNLLVKSVLPFLLLFYSVTARRKLFWFAVVLGTFYGLSLLNKMFVVILFAPLILHLCLSKRLFTAARMMLIPLAALALLVFVQNPHIRPEFWTARDKATAAGKPLVVEGNVSHKYTESASYPASQFIETIYLRVFIVPGEVVTAWFNNIPANLPFANGCGYRLVAAARGCEFRFFPSLVHDIENPRLVKEGVHGTMTAASFMEDYANFGTKGLVLSGVLLALVLTLVARLFAGNWRWALILNFIPISMMLELPLTTVMLTGGWALSLLLYYVFRARLGEVDAGKPRTGAI